MQYHCVYVLPGLTQNADIVHMYTQRNNVFCLNFRTQTPALNIVFTDFNQRMFSRTHLWFMAMDVTRCCFVQIVAVTHTNVE